MDDRREPSAAEVEDRRLADLKWRVDIDASIYELHKGQEKIMHQIEVNTAITEFIFTIIDNTKAFWNFCTKASRICIWIAKKGTIIAIAITATYHALDAIASHDIGAMFAKWWGRK